MIQLSKSVLGLAVVIGLSGCASISEKDCRLGDWYQHGLQDGQNGASNKASSYAEDCKEYGVTVNTKLYNDGRDEGLKSYCTYENGSYLGESGGSYNNVCPAGLSAEFLSGYKPNKALSRAKSTLDEAESRVYDLKARLEDKALTEQDRKAYKAELRGAKKSLERAKGEVNKYEYELTLHKIDREISQINKKLSNDKLAKHEVTQLTQRIDKLNESREMVENMYTTENTIRNIKDLADLF